MDTSNEDKNDDKEKVRFENELEKLKLMASHGATFSGDTSELTPDLEKKWLEQIQKFDDQIENGSLTKVKTRLDNPDFPPIDELKEHEISEKLGELLELMAENGIYLDTLAEVPEPEMYRFITEELFEEEIDDIQIEGYQTHFIYEEFHPNAEVDARHELDNFFMHYLDKEMQEYLNMNFGETVLTKEGKEILSDEFLDQLFTFLEPFDKMQMNELEIQSIQITEDEHEASIEFFVSYTGWIEDWQKQYEGASTAQLRKGHRGFWNIYSLTIPPYDIF